MNAAKNIDTYLGLCIRDIPGFVAHCSWQFPKPDSRPTTLIYRLASARDFHARSDTTLGRASRASATSPTSRVDLRAVVQWIDPDKQVEYANLFILITDDDNNND